MSGIDRRSFLAGAGAAFSPGPAMRGRAPEKDSARPNVIWVFGDQHRAQALSCAGDPNVNTPNIDTLAGQGVRFSRAVSGFPLCCPFRGSLLTGRYPHHCVPGHEYPLPEGQSTIANVFREAGYRTAYFGKWHLDGYHEREGRAAMHIVPPARRGAFEIWTGYENNNSQYDSWVHGGQGANAFHRRLPGYETDELTSMLVDYIREQRGAEKPFFAVLSVQPPHDPYIAPPEFMVRHNPAALQLRPNLPAIPAVLERARREMAGYYAAVENLDANLGRIRNALAETGATFSTHILFFSDHGDMLGSHGQFRKMTPHEEAIRIPFVIGGEKLHGYEGRGSGVFPVPLNHVDIAPTTLGLCGIRKPSWMEGTDYSRFRLGGPAAAPEPDSAYLQSVIPTGHGDSVNKPWRGVVTKDGWKYVCFAGVSWLMFNLNDDPYEQANLAHNPVHRKQRQRLIARLRQWVSDTADKFEIPED